MRIYEILIEAISVTHIADSIRQGILDELGFAVRQMYYKKKNIPEWVIDEVNYNNDFHEIIPYLRDFMYIQVRVRVSAVIQDVLSKIPNLQHPGKVEVRFVSLPDNVSGQVSNLTMFLANRFLMRITNLLVEHWIETTLDNIDNTGSVVDQLFRQALATDIALPDHVYSVEIDDLISTVIHEAVHIVQHDRQQHRPPPTSGTDKDTPSLEYRSYLERNPEKFAKVLDKVTSGTYDTDSAYKIYRASPQEIAAFAHQSAYSVIKSLGIDFLSLDKIRKVNSKLPTLLARYGDTVFKGTKDPVELKVYKRFMKLMSQEVLSRIEARVDQLKTR